MPGAKLWDGLRSLHDDSSCIRMSQTVCEGVAEVYVESFAPIYDSDYVVGVDPLQTQQSIANVGMKEGKGEGKEQQVVASEVSNLEQQIIEPNELSSDEDSDYLLEIWIILKMMKRQNR